MNNPLLNFNCLGQGQPLLIIHGLFGSSRNWQSLSKQFSDSFMVITLDLRNHGDSFHSDEMNYPDMVEDVKALIEHLQLSSVHVLGHSMGGKVAMSLCHRYPQLIDKLVVADIAPVAYQHDYDELIEPILRLDLAQVSSRKQADQQLTASISDQRVRLFLLQNLVFEKGRVYWKLNWPVLQKSMSNITGFEDISNWLVTHPSLFIRGAMSPYVNDRGWHTIRRHFAHAELQSIEGAGHWLHAEKPDDFFNVVSDFLKR